MAVLDSSNCSALTGWTSETGGGAEGTVAVVSGAIKTTRTAGDSTNPLGFVRTAGQTGATGHTIYWAFTYSGITNGFGNFLGLVNDGAVVTHAGSPGIYVDDIAGTKTFITWRGTNTSNSAIEALVATQYWGKAVINVDGTITFSISSVSISGPWQALSSSVVAQSFDATASTIHFIGCDVWSTATNVVIDDFYYTDDGIIPSSGGDGTAGGHNMLLLLGD